MPDLIGHPPHQPRGHHQRESRPQPRDGKLQAHRECHRPVLEPTGDAARDGHPGNLAAQAEQHTSGIGNAQGLFRIESGCDGPEHECCPGRHHPHENTSGDADAPAVQQHPADYESAEYAEDRIPAGVQPVSSRIPSQLDVGRVAEYERYAGEHIVEEIRAEHRHYQAGQCYPGQPPLSGHCYLSILGSSRPSPFFLSTTLSKSPRSSAATPRQASIARGAV